MTEEKQFKTCKTFEQMLHQRGPTSGYEAHQMSNAVVGAETQINCPVTNSMLGLNRNDRKQGKSDII